MNYVEITAYERREEAKAFTVYRIEVTMGQENWIVYRRYKEFNLLFLQLKKKKLINDTMGIKIPPKKPFGNNFDVNFLENRMQQLNIALQQICDTLFDEVIVQKFLSPTTNRLSFS